MTEQGAKAAVLISLAGSGAIVVVGKLARGQAPAPRTLIGGAFLFVVLGFAAEAAPDLAGWFALLILAAVMLSDGGTVFNLIGGKGA